MARIAVVSVFLLFALCAGSAAAADVVSVADPAGGARWTVTQSVSGSRICGQLRRGTKARTRPCARLDGRLAFSYHVRTENAQRPRDVRTVLVILLTPDVVSAKLSTPGGPKTYRRRSGRPRILLAVLSGRVEQPKLTVHVRRGGKLVTVVQEAPPAARAADPAGGPAWRSVQAEGSGGGVCAAWERVPARFGTLPQPLRGTPRCGPAGAVVPVAAAQLVDGRLVVFGRASAPVTGLRLTGPGLTKAVALEPTSRALLSVLPGGVDPAGLRLVARLADGREVERALDVVK